MRIFKILAASLFLFLIMLSFNCTMAGTEMGLIGTWTESNVSFTVPGYGNETASKMTLEIAVNDTGSYKGSYTGFTTLTNDLSFTISKGDSISKTISLKYTSSTTTALTGIKKTYTYSLSGNQLKVSKFEIWNNGAGLTVTKDVTFTKE